MQRQATASKQLLEALADRAARWEAHDHGQGLHHSIVVAPPPSSSTAAGGADPQPQDAQAPLAPTPTPPPPAAAAPAAQEAPPSPSAAPAPPPPALASATSAGAHRSQLLLLQHALCPLTRGRGANAELRDDDLKPHAAPKAKQVYDTFVKGIQQRPWFMLSPDGAPRLLWDLLLFFFTAGLVVYVPVLIAFTAPMAHCAYWSRDATAELGRGNVPPPNAAGVTFLTLTNAAFLLDIALNFITGVMCFNPETNLYETSYELTTVARRYASTWLVVDVVSCLPMECMLTAGGVLDSYNLGHVNRLLKVAGALRRAHGDPFRIINRIPYLAANFNYSTRLVVVSASLLLLGLHYFACALWLVLRAQDFPAQTWPVQLSLVGPENVYQQWTWAVFAVTSAMIGLGYGSYPPVTFPEAVLWIVEMIVMAGGFAVVNAFIFSAILEFLSDQARYKAQLMRAQKEVEHRRLSPALASRVISYTELKHSRRSAHMPIESIMSELEPGLRLQVALASVGHLLRRLPVLRACPQLLQRVALLVVPQVAAEGQLVAIPGTPASHLYFVTQGFADVYMGDLLLDTLVPGDSFCEGALLPVPPPHHLPPRLQQLWSGGTSFSCSCWPTLFAVRALSNCSLMVLSKGAFWELVQEYAWAEQELHDLGRQYAAILDQLPMLDDVWRRAAAFDPLRDPLALLGSTAAAAGAGAAASKAGGGAGGAARVRRGLGRPGRRLQEHMQARHAQQQQQRQQQQQQQEQRKQQQEQKQQP